MSITPPLPLKMEVVDGVEGMEEVQEVQESDEVMACKLALVSAKYLQFSSSAVWSMVLQSCCLLQ